MTTSPLIQRQDELGAGETRLMLRAAQLYYRLNLTQDEVGKRLGVSRFKVGRLLDRALRESAVRIEIVHPVARLVRSRRARRRFELRGAVVTSATGCRRRRAAARERVAAAAAPPCRDRPAIGVSWGRTMLELAAHLEPGWTAATEIVQLNGAISRSARPTRAQEVVERFGTTAGAAIRLMAAPAIVGSAELRRALEDDPAVGETLAAARTAPTAVFGMGVHGPDSVHVASGYLDDAELAALSDAGAVGDVLGRFTLDGRMPSGPRRPDRRAALDDTDEAAGRGLAAARTGAIAWPPARAGLREPGDRRRTADWVLAHG
jgi:deoxyribonucleoside regulator